MGLFKSGTLFFYFLLWFRTCLANDQHIGQIYPGFSASRVDWQDHGGFFLLSNSSAFAFGFFTTLDVSLFVLVVIHLSSYKVVWTANRGLLVRNSDKFVFDRSGNAYLEGGNGVVWATNTTGQRVRAMELMDSGNLVLLGENGTLIWQSFSHPTDTLLPGQAFVEGMRLKSFPNRMNLFHYLSYLEGDLVLYAGFETPQVYWSLSGEAQRSPKNDTGKVHSASLVSNSWKFYDKNGALLWKTVFSDHSDNKTLWAAILDPNGAISFYDLNKGKSPNPEAIKVPQDPCGIPEPCDPYYVCFFENWCECPALLKSRFNCKPPNISTCSRSSTDLVYVGEELDYFALKYVAPVSKSTLSACKEACLGNCSCLVLFFENSTGRCFHFDQTGSFQRYKGSTGGYVSYLKISTDDNGNGNKNGRNNMMLIVVIVVLTVLVIVGLITGFCYYNRKKKFEKYPEDALEEDDFLDSLSGVPARFTFNALCRATKDFSTKIGEGGFGSVYLGVLEDGTQLAVKKLEGVGQGAKEFKAEVSIIGSIHHVHLVKLKGFCAEGPHRLLVYEYMARGSLDKWIFKNSENTFLLNWDTRYNIAIGTAKGLAYLHEECEVRIIHCDIKPQNVLLDDNFTAKVSDFGLAKLMSREQSHVFTTLRGTRGYLAPEWITNYAISEKSDVFSYGMVLLEIIGGRKNYDQWEGSEKAHFPSYVFRMMEEGKLKEVLDQKIDIDDKDERAETALKVALWCIQDDVNLRPSMTKVAQMLEGLCPVPDPPSLSQSGTYSAFMKMSSGEATSSDFYSNVPLSCVQLSGPR
ncbi:G-type lectin S-receptor-like serine/threonine-protein kinase SD2-5 [Abrus precatorius]|uniref:Receptor-like serine/threonine-protein kinase n=1 Tax=Abrus precatorius TaxID=3816 RepID=A0A8B8KD72_ABRPR|nr:G-type lectin S-receptor-like serine/threonine-protein kinase SD2-5 [Abrus precatorius]XP_027341732.1 G-type lectin S-receptor-like serine/threonine-protein kinase SD2-5 [Abrus precatorius]